MTFAYSISATLLALLAQVPPKPPVGFKAAVFDSPAPIVEPFESWDALPYGWEYLEENRRLRFFTTSMVVPALTITAVSALTIRCGEGSIVISMKDGSITFQNCDPDEAARQFWFKVAEAYPYFRSAILAGYKP